MFSPLFIHWSSHIQYPHTYTPPPPTHTHTLTQAFDSEARIFIIATYSEYARQLICKVLILLGLARMNPIVWCLACVCGIQVSVLAINKLERSWERRTPCSISMSANWTVCVPTCAYGTVVVSSVHTLACKCQVQHKINIQILMTQIIQIWMRLYWLNNHPHFDDTNHPHLDANVSIK